jgi:nucleoside-diphosphate-sugar epimerase
LDYKAQISLDQGLKRFVTWFKEYRHLYQLPGH